MRVLGTVFDPGHLLNPYPSPHTFPRLGHPVLMAAHYNRVIIYYDELNYYEPGNSYERF